jgi:hypothetical protein
MAAAKEAEAEVPGSFGEPFGVGGAAEHLPVETDHECFVALVRREAPDRGIEPVQGALPERSGQAGPCLRIPRYRKRKELERI